MARVMPEEWTLISRNRDPAADGFNCMLNYGYGVLYSMVEKGIIVAGLDPYIGFIHADNYNKKSFVSDLLNFIDVCRSDGCSAIYTKNGEGGISTPFLAGSRLTPTA